MVSGDKKESRPEDTRLRTLSDTLIDTMSSVHGGIGKRLVSSTQMRWIDTVQFGLMNLNPEPEPDQENCHCSLVA